MSLKTLVKVGSITNLSDARYCAGMGVDLLGFQTVEGQPGFISPKSYQEIRGWITGPQIVAEIYGIKSADEVRFIIENYQPDFFEVGLDELQHLGGTLTLPYILNIGHISKLPSEFLAEPAYLLCSLEVEHSRIASEYEILLEIKNVEEVKAALNQTGIAGVCLRGGSEISPGLKTYDDLAEIFEVLEED
jgi:phosphoribosylanthranilate isomerase